MTAPVPFFFLAVLLAIARRGSSIQCQICASSNIECTGSIRECNPEFDSCGAVKIEIKTPEKTHKTTRKVCTTRSECTPGAIFMDLGSRYQELGNSICCTTDGCNTATLTEPTRNETLNGLRCPFCYTERPDTCGEEVINCRGSETQCFTREAGRRTVTTINSVTTITYEITHKGCATESFCANAAGTGTIISGQRFLLGAQEITCRAASHEVRHEEPGGEKLLPAAGTCLALNSSRLYLQAFAVLLMTKYLYGRLF